MAEHQNPLSFRDQTKFEKEILRAFREEYSRALSSGAFPDSSFEPGSHVIAKIALIEAVNQFKTGSPMFRQLLNDYQKI